MTGTRDQLLGHLEAAMAAYGADLSLPAGQAMARERAAPVPPADAALREQPAVVASEATAGATADVAALLAALRAEVLPCTRCKLSQGRQHAVFGEGNVHAKVMFIGEAPGANEDRTGRPFVGAAGQLLDRIIAGAMGMKREDVYIANVNKCRPPENREPQPDEVAACLPFLRRQVAAIRPAVIVALGRVAAHNLLGSTAPLRALRGRPLSYEGIPVVVTYHPAALLRDPGLKRDTWEDIKRVNRMLGLPEVPGQGAAGGA